jgi:signal transduction histidine kinase
VSDLEQLKTQMIRITAHDLRNPLGTISGYVQLLDLELKGQLSERHREFLGVLAESTDRIDRISRNILALERANSARNGLIAERVDLVGLARLVGAEYRLQANREAKTFTVELPPQAVPIQADRVLIQEAISNLVGNAFKYTPAGGEIRLGLRVTDEQAIIEVNDNGFGIPAEQQAGLFQPFYRVKTAQTKSIKGSGLGLSLVKTIVERHGGQIQFQSETGVGSQFRMLLPLPAARKQTKRLTEKPAEKRRTSTTRKTQPPKGENPSK